MKAGPCRGTVWTVNPRLFLVVVGLGASAIGVVPACSPTKNDPPPDNGVNDVRQACQIRNTWTMRGAQRCSDCINAAPNVSCNCEQFKDFAALCLTQGEARRADPQCTIDLDNCVNLCDKTNCDCIEGCYANAPSCKQHDAARDGCVADVCAQYCK